MQLSYDAICFDLFGTLVDDEGNAIEGAAALLSQLAQSRIAIVTSAPRRAAQLLLARAGLAAPPVMIADDDVAHGKPAPDPYALAVVQLGIAPQRALAIEDSRTGVDAAKAAGLDAAFILKGRPSSVCPRADYFIGRLSGIGAEPDGSTIVVSFG